MDVDDAADAAKTQGPEYLQGWMREMERQLKVRSAMGGENRDAPRHVPGPTPPNLVPVYTTSAWSMMRKLFYPRIQAMERKDLGVQLLIRNALAQNAEIVKYQNSFRLPAPSADVSMDTDYYQDSIRFIQVIMSRPWTVAGAIEDEERHAKALTEPDSKDMEVHAQTDSEYATAVATAWAQTRQQNHTVAALEEQAEAMRVAERKAALEQAVATATATAAAQAATEANTVAAEPKPKVQSAPNKPRKGRKKNNSNASKGKTTAGEEAATSAASGQEQTRGFISTLQESIKASIANGEPIQAEGDEMDTGGYVEHRGYTEEEDEDKDVEMLQGDPASAPQQTEVPTGSRLRGRGGKRKKTKAAVGLNRPTGSQILPAQSAESVLKRAIVREQVGIHQFLKKNGTAEDMEVEFLRVQAAAPPPPHLPREWPEACARMGLRQVAVPGFGSCGAFAAHVMQWGKCPETVTAAGWALREAEYYTTGVSGLMHHNYDEFVATKVIDEQALAVRYHVEEPLDEAKRQLIRDEIHRAGIQRCDHMTELKYWWRSEELRVLACWLRQPILVFDVAVDGTIAAQLHALAAYAPNALGPRETVVTRLLSHGQASALLQEYEKAQVVPLTMVLEHGKQHFEGLRVEEERYEKYAMKSKPRAAMKKRLHKLLKDRGMYVPPSRSKMPLYATVLTTQPSSGASAYTPSECSSGDSSAAELVPMRGPGAREMVRLAELDEEDTDEEGDDTEEETKLQVEEQTEVKASPTDTEDHFSESQASAASTFIYGGEGDVTASVPLFQASLLTPESATDTQEYIQLLPQLRGKGPVPEENEVALKKVERDNRAAFRTWKKDACHKHPELKTLLVNANSLEDACDALIAAPQHLLDLLRHLPYVPVLAGRSKRNLFTELGKELMTRGRIRLLQRISLWELRSSEGKQLCEDWLAVIESLPTISGRLAFAQQPTQWARLIALLPEDQRPLRSIPELEDDEWGTLIAHLMVSPSIVRDQLVEHGLEEACDMLMSWTAHDLRVHDTMLAAKSLASGQWYAPKEFLEGLVELGQHPLPIGAAALTGGESQY